MILERYKQLTQGGAYLIPKRLLQKILALAGTLRGQIFEVAILRELVNETLEMPTKETNGEVLYIAEKDLANCLMDQLNIIKHPLSKVYIMEIAGGFVA